MSTPSSDQELSQVFLEEAQELIGAMQRALADWRSAENRTESASWLRELFRSAHTLKGSADAMGYHDLARLARALAETFRAAKQGSVAIDRNVALLAEGIEACRQCLAGETVARYQDLLKKLERIVAPK